MYALMGCLEHEGEPTLIAIARTLPAVQRKFRKAQEPGQPRYRFIGVLTEAGLVNYYGKRIHPTSFGSVTLTTVISRE